MLGGRELEERLIGGLLRNHNKIHEIRDFIKTESFANEDLRGLYRVICELTEEGTPLDKAIVAKRYDPENENLPANLGRMQAEAKDESIFGAVVQEVADLALRRKAISIFKAGIEAVRNPQNSRNALAETQAALLEALGEGESDSGAVGAVADRYLSKILRPPEEKPSQIYTGMSFVDEGVGAMGAGNLIVLGGSTSAGKSALAAQIALAVAQRNDREDPYNEGVSLGCPVLYVSLEMEPEEITARYISQTTRIPVFRIDQNELNHAEQVQADDARRSLKDTKLWIESLPKASVSAIVAMVMKYQKTHGVGLVVVDHLHYIRGSNRKLDRFAQIEEVVMDLKAAAKQTQIPWLAISHLSRDIAKRPDKRPHLTDLFGASEIEKSADVVFFVHRQQYWMERESKPREGSPEREQWDTNYANCQGRAEIIVEKRRRGKGAASRHCHFDEELTLFWE